MNYRQALLLTLLIFASTLAQENRDAKIIRLADLSDTIEKEKAESYLTAIEVEIGKVVSKYPQLSSWKKERSGKYWSEAGKTRTEDRLTYAHGLKESRSSKYLDRFATKALFVDIRIVSQSYFSRLSGVGAGTVVFGFSVAGGCVIANVTSANPKVPKLEKTIKDIIERRLTRSQCY